MGTSTTSCPALGSGQFYLQGSDYGTELRCHQAIRITDLKLCEGIGNNFGCISLNDKLKKISGNKILLGQNLNIVKTADGQIQLKVEYVD